MRTKTLILSAAFGVAGMFTSSAQVYSVNAVGYINVTVPPGFSLIANQLNNGGNTLAEVIPAPPFGTTVYKLTSDGYQVSEFDDLDEAWTNPALTLAPGEGAFIRNVQAQPFTVTFVGEVPQGNLQNPIPQGFSIRSSQVPQAGLLTEHLGFPAVADDRVYLFRNGAYEIADFDDLDEAWSPVEPNVNVGEAFFVRKVAASSWDREFSVNQ